MLGEFLHEVGGLGGEAREIGGGAAARGAPGAGGQGFEQALYLALDELADLVRGRAAVVARADEERGHPERVEGPEDRADVVDGVVGVGAEGEVGGDPVPEGRLPVVPRPVHLEDAAERVEIERVGVGSGLEAVELAGDLLQFAAHAGHGRVGQVPADVDRIRVRGRVHARRVFLPGARGDRGPHHGGQFGHRLEIVGHDALVKRGRDGRRRGGIDLPGDGGDVRFPVLLLNREPYPQSRAGRRRQGDEGDYRSF